MCDCTRLQPSAIVTDEDCAACDFNRPGKTCLRPMQWVWRGETFAASTQEYFALKNQLGAETFPASEPGGPMRFYSQLPHEERAKLLKDRLKKYCQRVSQPVLSGFVMLLCGMASALLVGESGVKVTLAMCRQASASHPSTQNFQCWLLSAQS